MSRRFARTVLEPGRDEATDLVRARIGESIAAKQALLGGEIALQAAMLADRIVASLRDGGKVLLFGNGGSAADATHLAAEFVGRFRYDRAPLPALSLTDNASSISAIGNDYTYEEVFARQVHAFGQPGDVAIGITTSGTSANVVAGLAAARARDLHTAALTGRTGGPAGGEADVCLCMPATETARVQECYLLVGHVLCELVERSLFPVAS
jgi:D-sedoheptulose 7-phosphate isomerase